MHVDPVAVADFRGVLVTLADVQDLADENDRLQAEVAAAHQREAALRTALAEPYIVQERVTLPSEPYPSWADGRLHVVDRMLDTAPYVAYGQYVEGCLTRLSTAALLNVTAGGGSTVPTFVVEQR